MRRTTKWTTAGRRRRYGAGSAFARQVATRLAGLTALFSVYGLWFIATDHPDAPLVESVIRTGGLASFAIAVLVGMAAFAAATDHFDLFGERLPETRKRDWGWLACYGIGACALMEGGLPLADWLMEVAGAPAYEYEYDASMTPPQAHAMRFLAPVAIGAFVVVSGVAGAAVGRMTEWSSPMRRRVARWFGCVGITLLFMSSLVLWGESVVHWRLPSITIPFVPVILPCLAAVWLVRAQGYGALEVLGLNARTRGPSAEAVERLVGAVVAEDDDGARSAEDVARDSEELETALFLRNFRRVARPSIAAAETKAKKLLPSALRAATTVAPEEPRRRRWQLMREHIGELGAAWAALSAGLLAIGVLGGVPPSLVPAAAVGGVAASARQLRRFRAATRWEAALRRSGPGASS